MPFYPDGLGFLVLDLARALDPGTWCPAALLRQSGLDTAASRLTSGKHNGIRLRADRNPLRPSRVRGGRYPSHRGTRQWVRSSRNDTTPKRRGGCWWPGAGRQWRRPPLALRSIRALVGTIDEGCLQLSFIVGAQTVLRTDWGKVARVNRRVCGVWENDLRGEG
jgi:hypothetical protein